MLPAYFANMAPVFAQRLGLLKFLAKPVDGGRMFLGKPIFGPNKTWRGFVTGVFVAIITTWFQYLAYSIPFFNKISLINYSKIDLWILGFLFGFGALFGDLIKSFFKRRLNIPPSAPWFPFDQLDFVIGSLIFVSLIYKPPLSIVVTILIISLILHILVNNIGYLLKIKSTRW